MSRRGVIAGAALLAFAGLLAPVGGALWYSWRLSLDWEHESLRDVATRVTRRAELSLAEVTETLRAANAISGVTPCSPEHVARMQVLAFDSHVAEEIGYFADGRLRCTSWGVVDKVVPHLERFDFTTADGVFVTALMQPLVTGGNSSVALELGSYNVLVDPSRFADVIVDERVAVTIASPTGQIVSTLHDPDGRAFTRVITGTDQGITDDDVFATSRSNGWMAVATEPRGRFDARLADQRRLLLPIAVLVGVIPLSIVVWLSRRRLSLSGELATAVRKGEFVVHYQPLIELSTGRCVGAEALVRWERHDGVLVRPDLFLPLAEETGLIEAITDQIVDAVGRDVGALLAADRSLHVAINLCASDVSSGRPLDGIDRMATRHRIDPAQLHLEMTEQGFVDIEHARPHLERARRTGYKIAIDDFGTGYSSLSHLQQLPLDILKIDKSFVDTIGTRSATSAVTDHIVAIAKELHLEIVAEGVQTPEQADYLRDRGVDVAQGWLYAAALTADDFIAFCTAHATGDHPSPSPV